jgi:hypothetical protein
VLGAAGVLGATVVLGAAGVLGAALAVADETAADGDAELLNAPVSAAEVAGLFNADAATMITISAPTVISPVSTLCRAGQDFRFGWGYCGGWPPP